MISNIQLLRNIGLFDSVSPGAAIPFARLTLVYAENGRGKTTLAAIFRSLSTGDPIPIGERKRLAAQHAPHIVLACNGGPPAAMFQNNVWNRLALRFLLRYCPQMTPAEAQSPALVRYIIEITRREGKFHHWLPLFAPRGNLAQALRLPGILTEQSVVAART